MNYKELLSVKILSTKLSQKSESVEDRTQKNEESKIPGDYPYIQNK